LAWGTETEKQLWDRNWFDEWVIVVRDGCDKVRGVEEPGPGLKE